MTPYDVAFKQIKIKKIKKQNKNQVFRRRGERRLRLMLHLGRVPQAAAGSVLLHGVQAFPGHRIFS